MKNKIRILTVIIILGLLALSLVSCADQKPGEIHTTSVIHQFGLQEYGNYVFSSGTKFIKCYNRATNKLTKACTDPECDGSCLLDQPMTFLNPVVDGKLYFSSLKPFSHDFYFACLDIVSGTISVLVEMNESEISGNTITGVYNDKLYYSRKLLREGGDKSREDDYEGYYCCIGLDGKNEERLMPVGSTVLYAVADGKLIMMNNGQLTAVDINTLESRTLLDLDAEGYTLKSTVGICGKYLAALFQNYVSENFIISINMETGEYKRITEPPVQSYCLTDDGIYYFPAVYKDQPFAGADGSIEMLKAWVQDDSLHLCSYDGTSDEIVYTDEDFSCTDFTVIEGEIIGSMSKDGQKRVEDGKIVIPKMSFGKLDLKTGTMTTAEEE